MRNRKLTRIEIWFHHHPKTSNVLTAIFCIIYFAVFLWTMDYALEKEFGEGSYKYSTNVGNAEN